MGIAIKIIVVKVTVKGVWCQCKRNLKVLGKKGRSPEEIAELIDFDVETVKKWLQTTEE